MIYYDIDGRELRPVVFRYENGNALGVLFKTKENKVYAILSADLSNEVTNDLLPSEGCIVAKFHNGFVSLVGCLIKLGLVERTERPMIQVGYHSFVELRLKIPLDKVETF